MTTFQLAWRNYRRNSERYRVLAIGIVVVVILLTAVSGILLGVTTTVRTKAARYFAGDVTIQSYEDTGASSRVRQPDAVEGIISRLPYAVVGYSRRSNYYQTDSELFFAGASLGQRRLIGVDWALERSILGEMTILDGSIPSGMDSQGALVSRTTAERLGAKVGDELIVSLTTRHGQRNTGFLQVRAIYEEPSFFGFTTYLQRSTLNELYGLEKDEVTEFGVYLSRRSQEERVAAFIQQELSVQFQVFPVLTSRAERSLYLEGSWDGQTYAVLTLGAQLAEIQDLVVALTLVASVVVAMFTAIVGLGVANTYALLVRERTSEIGTLRSMGMTRGGVATLFIAESASMAVVAAAFGLVLGVASSFAIRRAILLPGSGVASIFLEQGRVPWRLPWQAAMLIVLLAIVASLVGALRPALHAGRIHPADAMRDA